MRSVYKKVRAKVYFLTPEEGGRGRDVDLRGPRFRYMVVADFGLGHTEDGVPIRCAARVGLEGEGGGYVELGVEQTVQVEVQCAEGVVVEPGVRFELSEGLNVVARATVLTVLETAVE
jgi:translation elongation factor EF-Tu-like GTPase